MPRMNVTRRELLCTAAALTVAGTSPSFLTAQDSRSPRKKVVLTDEARKVHSEGYVFDGHNDLPWEMRSKASSSFNKRDIALPQPERHHAGHQVTLKGDERCTTRPTTPRSSGT